jgi:aquaporin Z
VGADTRGRAWRPHWRAYAAEAVGTALLVFVGLSAVIFDFGPGSPVAALVPAAFARRLLTGFLFGATGALVAVGPVGRVSGAHLNPVLSAGFWLAGSLGARDALAYAAAQFVGALGGAAALPLAWGAFGAAVRFGATLPGTAGTAWPAVAGETLATFALVGAILFFVGHPRLRPFTPAMLPPLVAVIVACEAPWSGASMNPARTLGPAVVAWAFRGLWAYFLGPSAGAAAAALAFVRTDRVHVAKLAHHGHDPHARFHGPGARAPVARLRSPRTP